MKNISRRVFIKGLAVAGVAAAASTVLAGCNTNMLPGTDNGTEEPETTPTPANTYTFKDGDKTLTFSSSKLESSAYVTAGTVNLYVALDIKNDLGKTVSIEDTAAAAGADYQVVPTYTLYDEDGGVIGNTKNNALTNSAKKDSLYQTANAVTVVDGGSKSGYLYFEGVSDKWARLDVKFTVHKKVAYTIGTTNTTSELEDFTFTYNK